jgi:hypothetical protein
MGQEKKQSAGARRIERCDRRCVPRAGLKHHTRESSQPNPRQSRSILFFGQSRVWRRS